jgi:hypothetical protein
MAMAARSLLWLWRRGARAFAISHGSAAHEHDVLSDGQTRRLSWGRHTKQLVS